jgi:LysR family glycine cleavage system transcriptional activator
MSQRLPPLPAIRAFESAARHGGFQRAGEELHVSAGAIAHQIKQLESWLGVPLFQRLARGVVLTAAGRSYAEALRPLLNGLADASEAMRRYGDERVITVTSVPSFVARWLMPRLGDLRARHPDIDLRVLASVHTVDFLRDGVDIAIRLGTGPYPGLKMDTLMEQWFCAVCSPGFRDTTHDLKTPADLPRHPLLHDEAEPRIPEEIDWMRWLRACGVHYRGGTGLRFSHTYLTLEAAASGQGVAVAPELLIAGDLRQGRLVRLFPELRVRSPYSYHLLRPAEVDARPAVQAFCNWIKEQARHDQEASAS